MIGAASRGKTDKDTGTGGFRQCEQIGSSLLTAGAGHEGLVEDKATLSEGCTSDSNNRIRRSGHKNQVDSTLGSSPQPSYLRKLLM